jgi:hypothetical protein
MAAKNNRRSMAGDSITSSESENRHEKPSEEK